MSPADDPVSPSRAPEGLEGLVVLELWGLSVLFEQRLALELAEFGMSVPAFRLLGELMGEPEGLRQAELARRLGVRPPTVSVAVAKLEAQGLVDRVVDPSDTRARLVRLSEGAPLGPGVAVLQRLEGVLLGGGDPLDAAGLIGTLRLLSERLRPPVEPDP